MRRKTYLPSLRDVDALPPSLFLAASSPQPPSISERRRKGREGSEVTVWLKTKSSGATDHAMVNLGWSYGKIKWWAIALF